MERAGFPFTRTRRDSTMRRSVVRLAAGNSFNNQSKTVVGMEIAFQSKSK
jgi:hypothetical protein